MRLSRASIPGGRRRSVKPAVADQPDDRSFDHAVDQQFAGDPVDLLFVERGLGSDSRGRRRRAARSASPNSAAAAATAEPARSGSPGAG